MANTPQQLVAAAPELAVLKCREADAVLRRVRTWIAGHTSTLNAGLLLLIGAMQLQKALSALLGGE